MIIFEILKEASIYQTLKFSIFDIIFMNIVLFYKF